MGRQKKTSTTEKAVLATAIINLLIALISAIRELTG